MASAPSSIYGQFIHRSLDTVILGGVRLHINPDSYDDTSEWIHSDQPTLAGTVRFSYTPRPAVHQMAGMTGNAGLPMLLAMEAVLKPQFGASQQPVSFFYPNRFSEIKTVWVNTFKTRMDGQNHLYYFYDIELVEYGPANGKSVEKAASGNSLGIIIPPIPSSNNIIGQSGANPLVSFASNVPKSL